MGSAMQVDLLKGIRRFKSRIDPERVYQAWLTGDYSKIIGSVPWNDMPADLNKGLQIAGTTFEHALDLGVASLPPPVRDGFRLDEKNVRIRDFIATRTGAVYSNLSDSSARNIQSWTNRYFSQALTPNRVAAGIRNSICLLPAHEDAVENYRAGLLSGGMSGRRADVMAGEYADRLLDYRANMIARTETKLATNKGQLEVWRQGADEGLIDREKVRKVWLVGGADPCEDCEAMEGARAPIDEPFMMADGTPVDFPPLDVHPHCQCDMMLDLGDDSGQDGENTEGDDDAL
jgi:hypothetical protein